MRSPEAELNFFQPLTTAGRHPWPVLRQPLLRIASCILRTLFSVRLSTTDNIMAAAGKKLEITAKIQLHIHLDGSPRLSSVLPLAKKRGITLPCTTEEQLRDAVVMKHPETLTTFLQRFDNFMPAYQGSLDAIHQLASEFAEDAAADNVIYTEARFCPHLLIGKANITADEIVEAVIDEFKKAEKKLNITLRIILCCIRSMPEISLDMVRLCEKFRDEGVVALDIAGDENLVEEGEPTDQRHFDAFKLAKEKGIHRTVHAGENGSSAVVKEAIDKMFAERIGHGYRTLEDDALYRKLLAERMHFECCPYSSILTGAVTADWTKHPIKKFADDNFSFSLNCDDPIITDTTLSEEFKLVEDKVGISRLRLLKTIFDGAASSFLKACEKEKLLTRLHDTYDSVAPEAKDF